MLVLTGLTAGKARALVAFLTGTQPRKIDGTDIRNEVSVDQFLGITECGLVSRASVEALRHQLTSSLTVEQAAERLGIGRTRIFELVRTDLLPRAVRTARGWLIPPDSIERLERFLQALPVIDQPSSDWLTVREATRQFGRSGLTLVRLLEFVNCGRVRGGRNSRQADLLSLLVHREDLKGTRAAIRDRQNQECGYPLHRLARELIPGRPLKDAVLRKWIQAGLLRAERQGPIWRTSAEEVERFRRTYCLSDEASRLLGISRSTLSRWEAAGRISAVDGRRTASGAGASVFRRADVERLLAGRNSQDIERA